ncbi:MAG: hypothetical protein WB384_23605, partial [Candidatus Sulfotelmatobacter sp.]
MPKHSTHKGESHKSSLSTIDSTGQPGENAVRDAEIIADILTAPADESAAKGENQQHFIDTAKNLLTGVILHVLASPEIRNKTLGGVLD